MRQINKIKWDKGKISLVRLIPNILTISGLCIGLSAIRFAVAEKWELSIVCIVIASFIDGIDGRIARLLDSASTFGAELDSLCDFVNFGIVPVLVTYLWIFDDYGIKVFSWSVVLFYAVCTSIRLARFNTMAITKVEDKVYNNFFIGIPAPAGALLALLPLINELDMKYTTGFSFQSHPFIIGIYHCTIGLLMASRIPTYSFKKITISPKDFALILAVSAILVITLFLFPWFMLPILGVAYIASIPFSYRAAQKMLDMSTQDV